MRALAGACTLLFTSLPAFSQQDPTRADSLRGFLFPERSCYDVRFYHLDVRIDPSDSTVAGSNTIMFTATAPAQRLQVDLFANMTVESAMLDGLTAPLAVSREFNACFVEMPQILEYGSQHTLVIRYSGRPQYAKNPPWDGGFSWGKDLKGNPWVVVTCQGTGASLWWPNKDHQSDEPDSMLISITVPPGLEDVSNGRLRATTTLPDGWKKYDWFVSSPINNYNVTVNIGKFAHFSDVYGGSNRLTLDYYVMPENLEKAKKQFRVVAQMMKCFDRFFGPYPFPEDGFKLIESPHNGMEHQSAVAYGNRFLHGYVGRASSEVGLKFDFIIVHESAHEWWGNNLTSNDIADMWIHESFGAYAEALFVECQWGKDEAVRYINGKKQNVLNDRSIIGTYNVQRRGSGDMYDKGQLVLNTLRHVIDNDDVWIGILKGLQERFWRKTLNAEDVFAAVNAAAKTDLTYFFKQYLLSTEIPRLDLRAAQQGDTTIVQYRWATAVKEFCMPAVLNVGRKQSRRITPTVAWQSLRLVKVDPADITADEDHFYIRTDIRRSYLDPRLVR